MLQEKILIGVPTTGFVKPLCFQSVYKIRIPDNVVADIEYFPGYGCAQARNKIACRCVDQDYSRVLFIDDDQLVPIDVLEKLLDCKSEIAAGYSMMCVGDMRTNISFYDKDRRFYDFITSDKLKTNIVMDVDAVGFSCILIKKHVFKVLQYPWFKYVEYPDRGTLSEDLYFCDMARKNNLRLVVDTSLKCLHTKMITI